MKYTGILIAAAMVPAVQAQGVQAQTVQAQPVQAPVAQPQVAVQPQAVAIVPAASETVLRAGTEIPLITREELTTKKKKLRVGQRFQMEVASNVLHNGVVVIPAGSPAIGELVEVRNKGMWGKSGYVSARIVSLRLGDRHIRLTGTFDDKGVTGTAGVVGAVALIPVAGFFTTGTSAMIPMGSPVKGFLDEDIAYVLPAAPAVQPVVAAPAATVPVAATGAVPAAAAK